MSSDATLEELMERAGALRDDGRLLDAAAVYGLVVERDPSSHSFWVQYAHMLKEGELFREALFAYEAAIRCDGSQPDPRLHQAHLLKRMGLLAEALDAFRALSLLPDAPHVEEEIAGLSVSLMQGNRVVPETVSDADEAMHPECISGFRRLRGLEQERTAQIAQANCSFAEARAAGEPALAKAFAELVRLTDNRRLNARLEPKAHLVIEDGRFVATTDNPQFSVDLDNMVMRPGWFEIEFAISTLQGVPDPLLYLEHEREWARFSVVRLGQDKEGRYRAVFLAEGPVMRLRLDPTSRAGSFSVEHFSLRQISLLKATREAFRRDAKAARATLSQMRPPGDRRFARGIAEILRAPAPDRYHAFLAAREVKDDDGDRVGLQQRAVARWTKPPGLVLVIEAADGLSTQLDATISSLKHQSYVHWQACFSVPSTFGETQTAGIAHLCAEDPRLVLVRAEPGATLGHALSHCSGGFVCILRAGDRLAPSALYLIAQRIVAKPATRMLYADEDRISDAAGRFQPLFKPDWDPDYAFATNYTGRFLVVDPTLFAASSVCERPLSAFDSFALVLEATETLGASEIAHIPQVLFHAFTDAAPKPEARMLTAMTDENRVHLRESLARRGEAAAVVMESGDFNRVVWPLPEPVPLVTLVIPTRDHVGLLKDCIDSILAKTDYPHLEIVVVDNGSVEQDTLAYFERVQKTDNIRVLSAPGPFNFSHLNNVAVEQAKGSVIGLINNDILAIEDGWLREMVSHAVRPHIGAVGAKLLYRSGHVQHAGIALGIGTVAGHPHKFKASDDSGYMGRLAVTQTLSAVTAACLVVEKAKYTEVGGLDAHRFKVAFNDVDFCLKLDAAGYRNIFTPHARLVHLESVTRGLDTSPEKARRYRTEADFMLDTWEPRIRADPYYNINLTRTREDFSLDD